MINTSNRRQSLGLRARLKSHNDYPPLIADSKLAMVAAIEIYNKPRFSYREQGRTMLLVNAWDLMLKSLLVKNGEEFNKRISAQQPAKSRLGAAVAQSAQRPPGQFRRRRTTSKRLRTLSWNEAFEKAEQLSLWPASISLPPVWHNLDLISMYRDDAVHFLVDSQELATVLYCLLQANVTNFRDVLRESFGDDLDDEFDWSIAPLRLSSPPVPAERIEHDIFPAAHRLESTASSEFFHALRHILTELIAAGDEVHRLLTHYSSSRGATS